MVSTPIEGIFKLVSLEYCGLKLGCQSGIFASGLLFALLSSCNAVSNNDTEKSSTFVVNLNQTEGKNENNKKIRPINANSLVKTNISFCFF